MTVSVTDLFGEPPQGIDLAANNEVVDDTVVAVLAFIATIAVIFRFSIRQRQRTGLQGDDWLILVALLGEYGTAGCTFAGNHFGAGKHVWATEPASLRKMSIALFIYPWIYVVATVGLKLSFCWTYMRIFSIGTFRSTLRCKTWLDRCLVSCVIASFVYSLSVWLPMIDACRPLHYFWDQYIGETDGKCMDYLLMWIVTGICSAVLDLLILLIPIPKVFSLQMTWTRKFGVVAVLALGSFVVIAAIIRLIYMARMMHATDITWALGPAQIWTALEPSLGIVSSCLITTFRPMLDGIRHVLGIRRVGRISGLASSEDRAIGSLTRASQSKKVATIFRTIDEEEDELALVTIEGGRDARGIARYTQTSLAGVGREGIVVDKSFSVDKGLKAGV